MRITTFAPILCLAGILAVIAVPARADDAAKAAPADLLVPSLKATTADGAWTELHAATHTEPPKPAGWTATPPSKEEEIKYYLPYVHAMTGKFKDFYTRFPTNTNALGARLMEFQMLMMPLDWGITNEAVRFQKAGDELLSNPGLTTEQHYQVLWILGNKLADNAEIPYLRQIVSGDAPDEMKHAAHARLNTLDPPVGKPVNVQFTAVDGRKVSLAALKGKVVLLDFWATWCPPCVREVPNVKAAYDELHPKGFEIVGISLDEDKDKLLSFTSDHQMAWPQYFDGLHWQNKYAQEFGIESVPSMWLIDKKGILRDMDAREDLSGEVKKLLAE